MTLCCPNFWKINQTFRNFWFPQPSFRCSTCFFQTTKNYYSKISSTINKSPHLGMIYIDAWLYLSPIIHFPISEARFFPKPVWRLGVLRGWFFVHSIFINTPDSGKLKRSTRTQRSVEGKIRMSCKLREFLNMYEVVDSFRIEGRRDFVLQ